MSNTFIPSLQNSGYADIKESIYSGTTYSIALDWATKIINLSNQEPGAIVSNENEIFYPTEVNYSGVRNTSRALGFPMPDKTVVYRRLDSKEHGLFIDIINPDLQIRCLKEDLCSSETFMSLVKTYQLDTSSIEFHIYYTKDCIKPRTWHIDGPTIKIFTYLTDVDKAHGPYAYQLSSHRFYEKAIAKGGVNLNLKDLKNHVSTSNFNPLKVVVPKGIKGTTFISNQAGIHRGLSQSIGSERYVLVAQLK